MVFLKNIGRIIAVKKLLFKTEIENLNVAVAEESSIFSPKPPSRIPSSE